VIATAAVRYRRVTTGMEKYIAIGSCSASMWIIVCVADCLRYCYEL
jgi:hypothetical protein